MNDNLNTNTMNNKWLIYCRVSSKKQVREWSWLSSQESTCRRFATQTLGLEIEKVFYDDGESWGIFDRKSIKKLFDYLDVNFLEKYTVVFEDLNRFSRDVEVHSKLKREFKSRWVELKCPNFQFEDSPEWNFKENISVAVSQYELEKNKQRVISRQTERLIDGYWCFHVPIGYKFEKDKNAWWKVVIKDVNWKIVQNALEKYACNELESLNDVARYFYKKWVNIWTIKNGKVYNSCSLSRAFRNILYTGHLECEKMWVSLRKAKHPALISMKTFQKIQDKLEAKQNSQVEYVQSNIERKDLRDDFPLRWFLYCENSKQFLSGWWSQWKQKKFPYYTFPRKSPLHWKSLNRDIFHWEFEEFLKAIQPREEVIEWFEEALKYVSNEIESWDIEYKASLQKNLTQTERKISNYLSRIGQTESVTLAESYEQKLLECEKEKSEILKKLNTERKNVWTPFKQKLKLVRNGLNIWKSSDLENKKKLLKNIFPEWIPINEKKQVWTPTFSLIYQTFSVWEKGKMSMVGHPRLELRTFSLKGSCSTNWANDPCF